MTDPIDTVLAEHFAERAKNAANDVSLLPWNDDQGCRRLPVFDDLERLPPWARHGIEWADRAKKADAPAEYVPVACETTVHTYEHAEIALLHRLGALPEPSWLTLGFV